MSYLETRSARGELIKGVGKSMKNKKKINQHKRMAMNLGFMEPKVLKAKKKKK